LLWGGWFCAPFVQLLDDRSQGRPPVHVAPNYLGDVFLLPTHDLGNDALREARDVELRGGGSPEVMEMQIAVVHARGDLRAAKC
jgi:hypothetical protein